MPGPARRMGVQPNPNASPTTNAPRRPTGRLVSKRACRMSSDHRSSPSIWRPSSTIAPPAIRDNQVRWSETNCPSVDALAPRATNTTAKPATKRRRSADCAHADGGACALGQRLQRGAGQEAEIGRHQRENAGRQERNDAGGKTRDQARHQTCKSLRLAKHIRFLLYYPRSSEKDLLVRLLRTCRGGVAATPCAGIVRGRGRAPDVSPRRMSVVPGMGPRCRSDLRKD